MQEYIKTNSIAAPEDFNIHIFKFLPAEMDIRKFRHLTTFEHLTSYLHRNELPIIDRAFLSAEFNKQITDELFEQGKNEISYEYYINI